MTNARLLSDDLNLEEMPAAAAHPMDSSRLLLGLMSLSLRAASATASGQDDSGLEGVIAPGVLRSLLSALRFRDQTTVRHSRRVAMMAVGMASYLGWEGRHLKVLEVAALLHDIGKIGVPDNILFKPGALGPDEAELMSLHHNIGVDVLQACQVDAEVLEIVGSARDYYNGATAGYKRSGNMVHMGARILAVADAYDALRTDHIYRKGKSHDEIMKVLMEGAGIQFDGNIVCALSRWAQSSGLALAASNEDFAGAAPPAPAPQQDELLEASLLCHIFSYLYLLESLYDGFYLVDSDLRFVVWNGGAERLLGHTTHDLHGRVWSSSVLRYADEDGQPIPDDQGPLRTVIAQGYPSTATLKIQNADGIWVDIETQTVPLLDDHGNLQGVAEIFRDLSRTNKRPQEYRDLRLAATRDALTGVSNRGELETQLELMLSKTSAGKAELFSVIFMDVDHFKRINDQFGHTLGDRVLIEVARLLQQEIYSGEVVARYGGEEFVILCPVTDLAQAVKRAERIRLAISRCPIPGMVGHTVTASFGVSEYETGDTVESILRRADKALYAAKHGGRNQTRSLTTAQIEEQARASVTDNERRFVYEGAFNACVTAEIVVYKLGGFVTDERARLVEVSPNRAVLRLGNRGLLPFWGGHDDRQPVTVELTITEEFTFRDVRGKQVRSPHVVVGVRVRPEGWIRNQDAFQARAKRVLKKLNQYFAGDIVRA